MRKEMKSRKKIVWTGIAVLLMLGSGGCRKSSSVLSIPQLVKTAEVVAYGGESSVTYPGKVKAAEDVKLAFRVAGPLKKVYVSEGQPVKKGQLLAELDPRDYQLQYDATAAEYEQVKGEADRIIELYQRGSVSVNEYDKAVAAKKRVTALYHANRNALDDTRLKAPFDGYVQNKYFSAPEIVNQGTPVLSMINDRYFEVDVDIPASDFIRREDFSGFYAVADAFPGVRLPLELIDVSQGANYNQLFNVRFRLKQDAVKGLAAGMSVTVTIGFRPGAGGLAMLPVASLFQQDGKSYVWLFDEPNRTIRKREVQVEQIHKDGFVLVKSDLQPGQVVVSAGVHNLKDGQKVRPLPPVPASNVGQLL
ncbi:MAG: efflux RND transporter periplasmic adaptor subunit [Odoribacter sp.]|nr:efflux RND transporter periplasmic adaptor subunit [Odoribacter sp.]